MTAAGPLRRARPFTPERTRRPKNRYSKVRSGAALQILWINVKVFGFNFILAVCCNL